MKRRERVKDTLRRLDVRPTKTRGQNFVIDPSVSRSIVEFAAIPADAHVVEIGPGLGSLTEALPAVRALTLIEVEPRFCEELAQRFTHAQIVSADVRTVQFAEIGTALTVVGNLPYSISTDTVFHLIEHRAAILRAVLLLQREFAERVAASPGGRDYGVLSVMAQLWMDTRLGPVIPGTSFHPPAKVQSRVLELRVRSEPRVAVDDERWFRRVVQASFSQRRRMLANSLRGSGIATVEQIARALEAAQIAGTRRAEELSIEQFSSLAEALRAQLRPPA